MRVNQTLATLETHMVAISAGTIALRDDRTARQWLVDLSPFLICRHPVTQALYAELAGKWPSSKTEADNPVENVSWLDAIQFCNLLSRLSGLAESYLLDENGTDATLIDGSTGYRLPSEAEWEYACRAGTHGPRYGDLDDIAWHQGNSGGQARPVGQKQPNAWGLYDMLGNVWEWCTDVYDPAVYGRYRIFRGGGWADSERGCLATNRRRSHPTFAIDDLGFRIARSM
ncbi:formylglycine-generating enzyme family protein [Dyella tabacisoli]|uniref:Formylglycine-generating enzyme family protein n=1 Tax=Dyella tabacisoli TaxID=2282381 RepID=A0A369ULW8_9GAMM|nr:SUMF1/EgtB/PvdO family nonheme iron enzyme [Dyella tabacisoli]RDD81744.1 formylglycine-generating enzyme family protein [Dyella tabacisoli]